MKTKTVVEPLSERGELVLGLIRSYWKDKGYSPSMRDLADAMGGVSTNAVFRALTELRDKGYVRREYHRARSIVPTTA